MSLSKTNTSLCSIAFWRSCRRRRSWGPTPSGFVIQQVTPRLKKEIVPARLRSTETAAARFPPVWANTRHRLVTAQRARRFILIFACAPSPLGGVLRTQSGRLHVRTCGRDKCLAQISNKMQCIAWKKKRKRKKIYLKQLGGRAVLLRKAIMATVIHGRLNLSAISHSAAVNSPNAVWGRGVWGGCCDEKEETERVLNARAYTYMS